MNSFYAVTENKIQNCGILAVPHVWQLTVPIQRMLLHTESYWKSIEDWWKNKGQTDFCNSDI
jgi:hypothetical protein